MDWLSRACWSATSSKLPSDKRSNKKERIGFSILSFLLKMISLVDIFSKIRYHNLHIATLAPAGFPSNQGGLPPCGPCFANSNAFSAPTQ